MVRWSAEAVGDLECIYKFIAKDSKVYAERVFNEFLERVDALTTFPSLGRKIPEIDRNDLREIFLYSYRIIYKIEDGEVLVLTVVNARKMININSGRNGDSGGFVMIALLIGILIIAILYFGTRNQKGEAEQVIQVKKQAEQTVNEANEKVKQLNLQVQKNLDELGTSTN